MASDEATVKLRVFHDDRYCQPLDPQQVTDDVATDLGDAGYTVQRATWERITDKILVITLIVVGVGAIVVGSLTVNIPLIVVGGIAISGGVLLALSEHRLEGQLAAMENHSKLEQQWANMCVQCHMTPRECIDYTNAGRQAEQDTKKAYEDQGLLSQLTGFIDKVGKFIIIGAVVYVGIMTIGFFMKRDK